MNMILKKRHFMRLAAIVMAFACLPFAASIADTFTADDYVSLGQLREEAMQGWQQTYTAHGREVVVAVNIPWMPEVDTCPIVQVEALGKKQVQYKAFSIFDNHKKWDHGLDENGMWLMVTDDTQFATGENGSYSGKTICEEEIAYYQEPITWQAEGVDLSYEEFRRKANQDISAVSGLAVDDFLLYRINVEGITYKAKEKDGVLTAGDALTKNGAYSLMGRQLFQGIPMLDVHAGLRDVPLGYLMYRYCNPGYYYFTLQGSKEVGVHTADVPLLSFEAFQKVLEAQIESGHLRGVDKMEFGYFAFYQGKKDDPTWLLLPMWRIEGGYTNDPNTDKPVMPYHDPRDTDGSLTYPAGYSQYYYSAQTGEMISPSSGDQRNAMRLPVGDILTWDDVGGEK